ncbi:hypothetical protein AHF37_09290 [Paragonimus kellicotti]|nr:hypothetical protein AHF37_09290 [Paragonimus kellicotti]
MARVRARKRSGRRGLNSHTKHSQSHDETMAPATVPELQLSYPPGRTEIDPKRRLKQRCHEGRGDRILVEEQQCNHSHSQRVLRQLSSPLCGPSPARALPEPDGTAENLLVTGTQPSDNCIGRVPLRCYTCQDETAVCQCIDQVENIDIGEQKPVHSQPGDEPEEVVTSHSLPPITEQNKLVRVHPHVRGLHTFVCLQMLGFVCCFSSDGFSVTFVSFIIL